MEKESPHLAEEPVTPYVTDYENFPDVIPGDYGTLDAGLIADETTVLDDPYIVADIWFGGNSPPGENMGFLPPAPPPSGKTYGIGTEAGIFTALGVGVAALAAAAYFTIRRNTHRHRPHTDHMETYNPLSSP